VRSRSRALLAALALACAASGATALPAPASFSLEQVTSYPFPDAVVRDAQGTAVAYVLDRKGVRSLWFAQAPGYAPHELFVSNGDDGQELSDVAISNDDKYVVYVRGGDHDANWPLPLQPDPASSPVQQFEQVWSVSTSGGAPKLLGEGDAPSISPDSARVAYTLGGAVMVAPIDGSAQGARMFFDRGQDASLHWSPDGSALAFVSNRGDHSFIAIYRNDQTPIQYLNPRTSQDMMPRWSPNGSQIAFVRLHGNGGAPVNPLNWNPIPWKIMVSDVRSGATRMVWRSGVTSRDSLPQSGGGPLLEWTEPGNGLLFLSERDNWPHFYIVSSLGGAARLLTPGAYMAMNRSLAPDRRSIVYDANTGRTPGDDDRRHLFRVDFATGRITELTSGASTEAMPVALADGAVAYEGATAQRPLMVTLLSRGAKRVLDADQLPSDFPSALLVTPREVSWHAPDGWLIHGQLFEPRSGGVHAALISVHGGPPRQMLLTWHYIDYYSNTYAMNQYLASRGFVVLSVNYRLGIGYGHDFNFPAHWGPTGASEYQDVLSGARYLQHVPGVDPNRVGIWGGSYGGYLTALALARNSDVFKAGVDWHGVHDWSLELADWIGAQPKRYQTVDEKAMMRTAWLSSPDASIARWRSPVLLVQGDDDRNVRFRQTVDLAQRLRAQGVRYEELVFPNEIHDFLRYATILRADTASAEFLQKILH
jgi:dipeptidyl aminopeptidase/acylaminoacyl peptidase